MRHSAVYCIKKKNKKKTFHGVFRIGKPFNVTYWLIKSYDLHVDLQKSIRVTPLKKISQRTSSPILSINTSMWRACKDEMPMNLILIILIFSRSIPMSNGTPSYNSANRKFFFNYSINSLSILKKKLGTHTWNSLLNDFCSLCSIQMSIFYSRKT